MLVVDTSSLDELKASERGTGRRDIGLFAMSYSTAYVASIAHYASYSQALEALAEVKSARVVVVVDFAGVVCR